MKLKYYLRGLGIGMAVTALILGISAQPQTTMEPEVTEESKLTADPETTTEPEATAEPETTTEPKAPAEPEMTTKPEATKEPELITAPEQSQTTITIKKGSDSGSVSRVLYEAGLVENAKAFDNYLCNNGYSRSINPGIYEIAPGTSEEEIAKIITGKH